MFNRVMANQQHGTKPCNAGKTELCNISTQRGAHWGDLIREEDYLKEYIAAAKTIATEFLACLERDAYETREDAEHVVSALVVILGGSNLEIKSTIHRHYSIVRK
jgi:hypothetical protein